MSKALVYLPEWRVLLCTLCGHCLQPWPGVWASHLRQQPHGLRAAQLKGLKELFGSYDLADPSKAGVPAPNGDGPAAAIRGLHTMDGWQCLTCMGGLTRYLETMKLHVSKAHQQKPSSHRDRLLWQPCKLQTFFAEKQHIRYFVVDNATGAAGAAGAGTKSLDSGETDFFRRLGEDVVTAEGDAKAEANTVHGFGSHRSAVVPWLRRTGIEGHTRGLKKDEMHASFAIPKGAESEPELFLMLEVMDKIFREAHS